MSKYSSDSNSRDRTRSYSRYYNQRHRSSSSSSTESSRHSRKYQSSRSESRHKKKSKRRHRSSSSSDYSSSRHNNSCRSYHKDKSRLKKKNYRRSSSASSDSYHSSSSRNIQSKSSKASSGSEKYKNSLSNSVPTLQPLPEVKPEADKPNNLDNKWLQKSVYDVMKREDSIEQIKQEGFVFKVFKPSSTQKEDELLKVDYDNPKINRDIINSLAVEDSTFLISNPDRLLHGKYRLLTKQERCNNWAKLLFTSFKTSVNYDSQ